MPETTQQNYANHRSNDFKLFGILFVILAAFILVAVDLYLHPSLTGVAVLIITVAMIAMCFRMRTYSLTVQDRVIRLEMRLRLAGLLSGKLADDAKGLTVAQLVGLRFASDGEMAELVTKVLREKITRADDIKKLVKNWQADFQRV